MAFRKDSKLINTARIEQERSFPDGSGTMIPRTPPLLAPRKKHPLLRTLLIVVVLLGLVVGTVRLFSFVQTSNNQVYIRIGNQQSALLDLRQSFPVSPYLLGANVFPASGTTSVAGTGRGFMNYGPTIVNGLRSAHIKLLRFPGGNWGDKYVASRAQLNAFSTLLTQVGASGMVQVPLAAPGLGQSASVSALAQRAALMVDYMNNPHSTLRSGPYAHAPFHPIKFWTVGNEPDRLINPATGKTYTVAEYVKAFIQFSLAMHEKDPSIKVFGPEISQFYGPGSGPTDAQGQLWMEGFLKGVSAYEQLHPGLPFHLLDGVSFHLYPFNDAQQTSALLMSSTGEWNYLLPSLHQLIRQDFGRDMPVAVTEINTNPNAAVPPPGFAALWWADTLGMLMSQQVQYVGFFSAQGVATPYPLFTVNGLHETDMLRVMQLVSHLQHHFVPLQIQREPVSVYATQDSTHQTVSLLFINKSNSTQLAQVHSAGASLLGSPWHNLNIKLTGYSMLVVTLHRGAGADAYSYIPAVSSNSAAPLVHIVCGQKTEFVSGSVLC